MNERFVVSVSPHIYKKGAIPSIMWRVFFAFLPSGIIGVYIFGLRAFYVIVTAILSAVLTEGLIQKLCRRKITIYDGSAALTGILLAYNLPSGIPLWMVCAGSFFAIAIVKQLFGGLGKNIFNPALAGRAFLLISWPGHMTSFPKPFSYDGITSATPLALLKEEKVANLAEMGLSYWDLFIGNRGGCIGEVCILALILGAIYLFYKKIITWHIPLSFIFTVAIFSFLFGGKTSLFKGDWLFHILSGGLILGAFFMATDYVTSPLTKKGKFIFGFACGMLTCVIRFWGGYPEGVSFSILIMNAFSPLIDRYTKTKVYGTLSNK